MVGEKLLWISLVGQPRMTGNKQRGNNCRFLAKKKSVKKLVGIKMGKKEERAGEKIGHDQYR